MSFWGALGTIGAVAATVATGGAAAPLIPLAASVGGAIDARNAEKKAAEQEAGGNQQAAAGYQPYVARGNDAGNTLAGLMGLPMHGGSPEGGGIAGPRPAEPSRVAVQNRTPITYRPTIGVGAPGAVPPEAITLATMMQRGRQAPPQTPSASSYGRNI